ncbi:MAG: NAD(P)-dependent oxidoreductase [Dehalococcoidales bacterium]|nr:MAG: NAD(P)-dependent oxidoreductase [Dehalococcoidales bacterium]
MKGKPLKKKRITITGLSGNIGHILYAGLKSKWEISGVDIIESAELPVTLVDINDYNSIGDAFNEAYAVIHLAANAYAGADWENIIGPNIIGTQNVFRAARESGVKKIIFASSNHVTGLYEKDEPYLSIVTGKYENLDPADIPQIDHKTPVRPDGYYGVSKVFGEALGRYYSEKYKIQVFCIRLGSVSLKNRPFDVRQYATLLMHSDLVKLVDKCLKNNTVRYAIFYGVSNNTWKFWDTSHIKDCLGWGPEENAEKFRA